MTEIQTAVNAILKHRRDSLQPVEETLARADNLLRVLADFQNVVGEAGDPLPPESVSGIETFPIEMAVKGARQARQALELAAQRLRRDCVNIGVAGRARQGKSTFLRAFSGLDDDAVPTGGEGFCTAARSEIRNFPTPGAQMALHSRESFFTETVIPYYTQLGLSPVPKSLDEFLFKEIPSLPGGEDFSRQNLYKVLHGIRANADKAIPLMMGDVRSIPQTDIRKFVTKDGGHWNFLAVRKAVIDAAFPHGDLPRELRLIDLPGLGELALNIEQELAKSVAELADIVLIVRMPQAQGDGFGDKDMETLNLVRNALPDLEARHWLALVLNHSVDKKHDNTVNVKNMLKKARDFDLGGIHIWACDCSNPAAVREKVIKPAMELLTHHAGELDRKRLDNARIALKNLKTAVAAPLQTLKSVLIAPTASGDAIAEEHGEDFLTSLRDNLRRTLLGYRPGSAKGTGELSDNIAREVKQMLADIFPVLKGGTPPATYQVWNAATIAKMLKNRQGGFPGILALSATNTRVAFTRFISSRLDPFFQAYTQKLKNDVVEAIAGIDPLPRLISTLDRTGANDGLALMAAAMEGQAPTLCRALRRFSELTFTYDANLHPDIRDFLGPLDPDDIKVFQGPDGLGEVRQAKSGAFDFDAGAAQIRSALDTTVVDILTRISKSVQELPVHPEKAIFAAAEELSDQLLWSDEAEREWRRVLYAKRRELWADRYAEQDAREKAAIAWRNRVDEIERSLAELAAAEI